MKQRTNLGKLLAKARIDRGELMEDMASNLGMSKSYLSAVELGRKDLPPAWIGTLVSKYGIPADELLSTSYETKRLYKIEIKPNTDELTRKVVSTFAREFDSLSNVQLIGILSVMEGE